MREGVGSKLRDLAVYLTISLFFVYGLDNVHTLEGKLLILLALVAGSIYEYLFHVKDNTAEYLSMYAKFRHLIFNR